MTKKTRLRMRGCFSARGVEGSLPGIPVRVKNYVSSVMMGEIHVAGWERGEARVEWSCVEGENATLSLSNDKMSATKVTPGTYRIRGMRGKGGEAIAETVVEVRKEEVVSVVGYRTVPSSSHVSWDGEVHATLENVEGEARYMWSNGYVTSTPSLRHVRPGVYCIIALVEGKTFFHSCPPAVIGCRT